MGTNESEREQHLRSSKPTLDLSADRISSIPDWLVQLEDGFDLDVANYPIRVSLKRKLNRAELRRLDAEMFKHGWFFERSETSYSCWGA